MLLSGFGGWVIEKLTCRRPRIEFGYDFYSLANHGVTSKKVLFNFWRLHHFNFYRKYRTSPTLEKSGGLVISACGGS
jgi:hypothetical protein